MNKITQKLIQLKEGVILPRPHGQLVWKGEQDLIIKSKFHKKQINRLLYLLEDNKCYGVIKLKCPEKITSYDFKDLSKRHNFSEEERLKWWKNKEVLFSYEFDVVAMFDNPRDIEVNSKTSHTFVSDFDFVNLQEELIRDIKEYNPIKASNKKLSDDWRIVLALYATKKSGGNIRHSLEDITKLSGIIYREINKRVDSKKMEYNFKPSKINSISKELYNLIANAKSRKKLSEAPFSPMKPKKVFHDIDETINYMFKSNDKYSMEKSIEGERILLVKKGDSVHLFSEDNKDITSDHSDIKAEATQLSQKDIILDCKLSDNTLNVFDCLYFGEDITSNKWSERKHLLHSLNFTSHIKEVNSIIVSNKSDAMKAIKLLNNLPGSEGSMIKKYDGEYSKDGESGWIKLMNSKATTTETKDVKEVSATADGKKVPDQNEQGPEDPDYKEWDKSDEKTKEMSSTMLAGIKYTSQPIMVVEGERVIVEGHIHKWAETRAWTSVAERHKHRINLDKMIAEEEGEHPHTHKLLTGKEMEDTTTSSPGVPDVQGKQIKKKPKRK
jgi:hypothetical protein